jgi:hypothetical protein
MRDLAAFRAAVTAQRRAVGRSQQELARAVGLHPHVLSRKLNGTDAMLTSRDAAAIVAALRGWGAVAGQEQPSELFDLLHVRGPAAARRRVVLTALPGEAASDRCDEVTALSRALAESRLVTVVGTAGSDRSGLAVAAARQVAAGYADGVAYADLGSAPDAACGLAGALGLPSASAAAERRVVAALSELQLLVLVDNADRLPDAGALLVRVLSGAPRLRFLVTCRHPLGVHGEHLVWARAARPHRATTR